MTAAARRSAYVGAGLVVLLAVLSGLFYYKWGGAWRTLGRVRAAGIWPGSAEGLTTGGALGAAVYYFRRIWIALVYGLLIGATVRTFISPRQVVALLSRGGSLHRQVAGGLTGAPLMLCSCCITPVFASVYRHGARLSSALALMLASPGLNPAALILTILLFPAPLAAARFAATVAAVFVLPVVLERLLGGAGAVRVRVADAPQEGAPRNVVQLVTRFAWEMGVLSVQTLPLVAAGVLLSSLLLPVSLELSAGGAVVTVALVAAIAVLVALPTFFEIPLAMLLLQLGAPGAAAAMLFAGPIVNLPSLLVLAREARPRLAVSVAAGIWLLAVLAGLAAASFPS